MEYQSHFILMADYNLRMNEQFYEAAGKLSEEEVSADKGAFFGSILGTLNHILVGDLIWLSRFSTHSTRYQSLRALKDLPQPEGLDHVLYPSLELLTPVRQQVDASIKRWLETEVEASDFTKTLTYQNVKGVTSERNFGELASHFFNHQTHHRGQASALLNQLGVDVGVTDFLIDIPDMRVE
ncbi:DinB family protein [Litoribrevibacter euphylliae]|uniref:DinB family protein n=1 Tax=Litoribrevibacter euphylliae TaxID=1834034 RepID=A0ABV7HF62_9GAMM